MKERVISNYAPVVIPTLNRSNHLRKCLESLECCILADKTDVYIGLDYPPSEQYIEGWKLVDSYLKEKEKSNQFRNLYVIRRNHNYGIKGEGSNVACLINHVKNVADRYILSEDDNVFSPNFLVYMNQCLEQYQDDQEIIAVTGYSFPIGWKSGTGTTVQKQNFNASAWGWGWWFDKLDKVGHDIGTGEIYNRAPMVIKEEKYKKGLFVAFYEYVCAAIIPLSHLKRIQSGRLSVTDYCTRQYLFVYDKYVISPLVSKVRNIGLDGSGVYCQNNQSVVCDGRDSWHTNFSVQEIDQDTDFSIVENDPAFLEENRKLLDRYERRPLSQHIIANAVAIGIRVFGLRFMRQFTFFAFKIWHRRIN